jgi:hypothetical protein
VTPAEAWGAVVEGEDAAVFAYSIAGARVGSGGRARALNGLDAHRSHRDRASAMVVAAGATPPAPSPAYDLPFPVDSAKAARRLMALVDNRLVALYADAAEATQGDERRWAARIGAESATRAVAWGAAPQAFPTGSTPA